MALESFDQKDAPAEHRPAQAENDSLLAEVLGRAAISPKADGDPKVQLAADKPFADVLSVDQADADVLESLLRAGADLGLSERAEKVWKEMRRDLPKPEPTKK